MDTPRNPIAAATHPDPYPYYAGLVDGTPVYRDEALGLWVACGAPAVRAVLTAPQCRVRPAAEPLPRALAGSPAGEFFGRLVRQNDGAGHPPLKQAIVATLDSLGPGRTVDLARERARLLASELGIAGRPAGLVDFSFRLPVQVVGSLLGVPPLGLPHLERWVADLVRSLAPTAKPESLEHGNAAAAQLLGLFEDLLAEPEIVGGGLLGTLARQAHGVQRERRAVLANGIGFLTQAYEATAGLIGNTLLALARQPEWAARSRAEAEVLSAVVREVARWDAPIQNTRRFLAEDGRVAGMDLRAGDAVLVVLAAANRDSAANAEPHRFDPVRPRPASFTFGVGPHACPGEALAVAIASAGVAEVLHSGLDLGALGTAPLYRLSVNARIPLLGQRSVSPSTGTV